MKLFFFHTTRDDWFPDELNELSDQLQEGLKAKGIEDPIVFVTSGVKFVGAVDV